MHIQDSHSTHMATTRLSSLVSPSTRLAAAVRGAARLFAPRQLAPVASSVAIAPRLPTPLSLLCPAALRPVLLPQASALSRLAQPSSLAPDDASARAAAGREAAQGALEALLPPLTAGLTLVQNLVPSIVLTGKSKHSGKNKRRPNKCNHGARPCSHVMRRRRAAFLGRIKFKNK